ncbi:hypothetical protein HY417_03520 [Candidatus Kaiserbacteria bacterium]|nr:hypothetical protein [Candidatus Kaiserbacteria bacterium]
MKEWLRGILGGKKASLTYESLKAERAKQIEGKPWDVVVYDDDAATVNVPMKDERGRIKGVIAVSYAIYTTDEFISSERTVEDIRNKSGYIVQLTRPRPTPRMSINNQTTRRTLGQTIRDLRDDAEALGVAPLDLQNAKMIAEKALSEAQQKRKASGDL